MKLRTAVLLLRAQPEFPPVLGLANSAGLAVVTEGHLNLLLKI